MADIVFCPHCEAPHQYIYYNDGKKRSQFKCKVCNNTFPVHRRLKQNQKNSKLHCPYCGNTLYKWKQKKKLTVYKCGNRKCPCRMNNLNKLNPAERFFQKMTPTHFTINYIYRQYHLTPQDIMHAAPEKPALDIFRIHNSEHVLGLVLAFYVSFAISARKTAFILRQIFKINVSYQSVLNYAKATAYHCHKFNLYYKGEIDDKSAGDETYIKIKGKNHYLFLFIAAIRKSITAYHLADNRGAIPAIAAVKEAVRTADDEQDITCISDGNPSYPAAIHFLNNIRKEKKQKKIEHKKVIGLQNLDQESTEYREFKQIIERLNRTYKFHVRPANGFNSFNGAMALTTLFVSHYNFLRPHSAIGYKTPIHIYDLQRETDTIQTKWIKMLKLAAELPNIGESVIEPDCRVTHQGEEEG